jgi:hypothetical protein
VRLGKRSRKAAAVKTSKTARTKGTAFATLIDTDYIPYRGIFAIDPRTPQGQRIKRKLKKNLKYDDIANPYKIRCSSTIYSRSGKK